MQDKSGGHVTNFKMLASLQVSRSTGQQVNRSAGRQVSKSTGQQVDRSTGRQVSRTTGQKMFHVIHRLLVIKSGCCVEGRFGTQLNSQQVDRSAGRQVDRSTGRRSTGQQVYRSTGLQSTGRHQQVDRSTGRQSGQQVDRRRLIASQDTGKRTTLNDTTTYETRITTNNSHQNEQQYDDLKRMDPASPYQDLIPNSASNEYEQIDNSY
ncbi:Hypothetical predicted protein, partial [Mytilus galloprovincialis]